jgi:hypothetical protein
LGATSAPAFGSTMPVFTNNSCTGSSASISAQIEVAELAQPTVCPERDALLIQSWSCQSLYFEFHVN